MMFVWNRTLTDLLGGQLTASSRMLGLDEVRRQDPVAPTSTALLQTT